MIRSDCLQLYTPSCTLSSASDTLSLQIPHTRLSTVGSCTFSVFGPSVWNDLPFPHQQKPSLDPFRSSSGVEERQKIIKEGSKEEDRQKVEVNQILNIVLLQLFVCLLLCFLLLSLFSISLLHQMKALVFLIVLYVSSYK